MLHVGLYAKYVKYAHETSVLYAEFICNTKRNKHDEHLLRQYPQQLNSHF